MKSKTAGVFKLVSRWFLGTKSETIPSSPLALEIHSSPRYSTNGFPGFAIIPVFGSGDAQVKLSALSTAEVALKTMYSTLSKSTIDLGHGLFSVTNGVLKIHISQFDMDFGFPMNSHILGTVDHNGRILLLKNVEVAIQIKYDSPGKISKIDLTFVLSEGKMDKAGNEVLT